MAEKKYEQEKYSNPVDIFTLIREKRESAVDSQHIQPIEGLTEYPKVREKGQHNNNNTKRS